MELKRVVVTGLGAITPLGNDFATTWKGMLEGASGAGPISLFDSSKFKTNFACEVKNFDPEAYLDRKEARKLDRYSQFSIVSAMEAIKDCGIDLEKANRDRIGVIHSTGVGGIGTFDKACEDYYIHFGQLPKFNPFFIPKMIPNIASGHISIMYNLRGPNYAIVSACATSTNGLIDAFNLIRLGKADIIVTGGSEAAITIPGIGGFNACLALSTRNSSPDTASRPFSKSRDGFVMGEGGVSLILEELDHALQRGAKIYAEVAGGGMSADAYHLTASHPEGLGAMSVMRNALEDAQMVPEDIDYINAHGTSTPLGDPSECRAIKEVFGKHAYQLNISSTKSMTGHMLGASGAVEALACIMAIQHQVVPPTINFTEGDEDPDIDYQLNFTFNHAQKREIRAALSNSFGFGGHNASIIVKKFTV